MFNYRRFSALVIKEFQDIGKNKRLVLMFLLPLGFCVLYKQLFMKQGEDVMSAWKILTLCVNMSLVIGVSLASAMSIAEEKEKKTLRTMLLAGLKPLEFFFGKSVVIILIAITVNTIMFVILGFGIEYYLTYFILILLVSSTATHGMDMVVIGAWIFVGLGMFSVVYRKIGLES